MRSSPFCLYRPARVSDNQGGWTASWTGPGTVYGWVEIRGFETVFLARAEEDILLEDVLGLEGRFWRVLQRSMHSGGPVVGWKIEMCDRPQVAPPMSTWAATTTTAP